MLPSVMDVTREGTITPTAPAEPAPETTAPRGRLLRIRVNELGKTEANILVPLGFARLGLKFGGIAVKDHVIKYGVDIEQLLKEAETVGEIVDVDDDGTRVRISVE